MGVFEQISIGIATALSAQALLYCFFGTALGTVIGVIPGIGPLAAIAMLLPLTFGLPPEVALIFLAGIYYGALYGGSTVAILLRIPGTAASAVVCLDGYAMARAGRANSALVMTTVASFFGGCFAILVIAGLSPPLATFAIRMGPAEYASLMVLGLVAAAAMSQGSILKGIGMVLVGILLGLIGMDIGSGMLRYTFGLNHLQDGLSIVVIAMGLFGVAELLRNLMAENDAEIIRTKFGLRDMVPEREDLRASWWPMLRGSAIGSALGILPGAGPAMSSFASYSMEKQVSKEPARFGHGAIEGVVGPEAANNAAAQTGFIPTLTLGIPGDAVMGLMLGALMIHGITPGPNVISSHPALFWGLVFSFWIGNLMLVVLNLPLIGLWIRLLSIPYRIMFPAVVVMIGIGIYSINGNPLDIVSVALIGVAGIVFAALRCDPAPLLLGFILGPMLEEYGRRAMMFSRGDPLVFVTEPISAFFLFLTVLFIASAALPRSLWAPHVARLLQPFKRRRK